MSMLRDDSSPSRAVFAFTVDSAGSANVSRRVPSYSTIRPVKFRNQGTRFKFKFSADEHPRCGSTCQWRAVAKLSDRGFYRSRHTLPDTFVIRRGTFACTARAQT